MNASQKKIMQTVAHWELVEGAERSVPGMEGFGKAYLAKLRPDDIAIINAYTEEKARISAKLADMLEAAPMPAPPAPDSCLRPPRTS